MPTGSKARANCPICGVENTRRSGMRRHFESRHSFAGVRFPGEGELVSCPQCGLKVPLLDKHIGTKACEKAAD